MPHEYFPAGPFALLTPLTSKRSFNQVVFGEAEPNFFKNMDNDTYFGHFRLKKLSKKSKKNQVRFFVYIITYFTFGLSGSEQPVKSHGARREWWVRFGLG
jgi:hypothetical protein